MDTKQCPTCNALFKQRKKGCCPSCGEGLHILQGKKLKGRVITMEEKETAKSLVEFLAEFLGKRDGIEVEPKSFFAKELSFVYELILRARAFLSRQKDDFGWTAASFVSDLIAHVLSKPWWRGNMKSYCWLRKKVSDFAGELYRLKREAVTEQKRIADRMGMGYSHDYAPVTGIGSVQWVSLR